MWTSNVAPLRCELMLCLFDMNKLLIREDFLTFSSLEKACVSRLLSPFYFTRKLQVTLTVYTFTCETPLTLLYR